MPGLVELGREGPVHVEMARLDGQVRRLERAAALLVDDVERADQSHVVDEVGAVAGAPATIEVAHERRAADGAEHEVGAAELEVAFGVAGMHPERRGRESHELLDLAGVQADRPGLTIDPCAGAGKRVQRSIAEHLEPDLGEDPQRGPVDRLHMVGGQELDRPERVDQPSPRELRDPRRLAPWASALGLVRHRSLTTRCYPAGPPGPPMSRWPPRPDFSCPSQTFAPE